MWTIKGQDLQGKKTPIWGHLWSPWVWTEFHRRRTVEFLMPESSWAWTLFHERLHAQTPSEPRVWQKPARTLWRLHLAPSQEPCLVPKALHYIHYKADLEKMDNYKLEDGHGGREVLLLCTCPIMCHRVGTLISLSHITSCGVEQTYLEKKKKWF